MTDRRSKESKPGSTRTPKFNFSFIGFCLFYDRFLSGVFEGKCEKTSEIIHISAASPVTHNHTLGLAELEFCPDKSTQHEVYKTFQV